MTKVKLAATLGGMMFMLPVAAAQALTAGPCHIGTAGDDVIYDAFQCMTGNAGNDVMYGRGGRDKIDGALVMAQYSSRSGVDQMFGGADLDKFFPGPHRRIGSHVGTVDRIRDFQSGETICSGIAMDSWRRMVAGSHTYIVVRHPTSTEYVIALVYNMGSKSATVRRCSVLD